MTTLQEYADDIVAPQYRQPLKTVEEACGAVGWQFVDKPICCGKPVEVTAFLGSAYFAECDQCGRFIRDVSGPQFGNATCYLPSADKISDIDSECRWIAGIRPTADKIAAEEAREEAAAGGQFGMGA